MPTDYKRLFLRNLKWDSEDNGAELLDTLKTASRARLSETKTGKVLVGTAVNGKTASYQIPPGSITPENITLLCAEMLDRYDEAKGFLIARGTTSPTSTEIYDEMLLLLQPVYETTADFSLLPFS